MEYKLYSERLSDGSWVVSDKQGHLVPMVQAYVHADYRERMAKLFAASPDLLNLLEELSQHVINGDKLQAVAVATVALDTVKGLKA